MEDVPAQEKAAMLKKMTQMSNRLNKRKKGGGVWSQRDEKQGRMDPLDGEKEKPPEQQPAGDAEGQEILSSQAERFRMKLIHDFRLLENLSEMEQGLEAPKYFPEDLEEREKAERLLEDHPYALVKLQAIKKTKGVQTRQVRVVNRICHRYKKGTPMEIHAYLARRSTWLIWSAWFALILAMAQMTMQGSEPDFVLAMKTDIHGFYSDDNLPWPCIVPSGSIKEQRHKGMNIDLSLGDQHSTIQYCESSLRYYWSDWMIFLIFALEQFIEYVDDTSADAAGGASWWFDVVIDIGCFISLLNRTVEGVDANFTQWVGPVIRQLQNLELLLCFRILKALKKLRLIKPYVHAIQSGLSTCLSVLMLMFLFIMVFMLLTMSIFEKRHAKINGAESVVDFKSAFWCFGTMWQLLTMDNYMASVEKLTQEPKVYRSGSYYVGLGALIAIILLLSFVFKNVIAAIIVNEHTSSANDTRWSEQQNENQRQLDMLQREMMREINADFADYSSKQNLLADGQPVPKLSTTSINTTHSHKASCWSCYFAMCRKHCGGDVDGATSDHALNKKLLMDKLSNVGGSPSFAFEITNTKSQISQARSQLSMRAAGSKQSFKIGVPAPPKVLGKKNKGSTTDLGHTSSRVSLKTASTTAKTDMKIRKTGSILADGGEDDLTKMKLASKSTVSQRSGGQITEMMSAHSNVATQLAGRRKSTQADIMAGVSGSNSNLAQLQKISSSAVGGGSLDGSEGYESDPDVEITGDEVLQAEWDTIVQRHIDLRMAPIDQRNETVWPRDILFDYLETMEKLMENMHEREEITRLVSLALLNMHDTDD